MSFPAPNNPQVIHIFVDDFNGNTNSAPALPLIDQGTTGWNNFYTQLCQSNCVNTLSIYDTRSVLPGKSNLVGNFIELGKTTYGICEVAGSVNPYDTPDGSDYIDRIITHNGAQGTNQNRKYDYITLENEYWNFNPGAPRNPLISGLSSYLATTNATNTTVNITPSGINGTSIQTGYMIEVNGEYRQIISIGTSTITVDRPFSIASGPTSFTVVNNQLYYDLDFDTFLYRVKNVIRPLALANNLKIEAYIGRNSEAYWTNAFRRIIPHLDRLLIEVEQTQPSFSYNYQSNSARNAIFKCSVTRTGTITVNGNTIFGTGTDFANDLGIKTRIYCNGQIFTILSINSATQQATTLETASPNITTQSTYTTYFDYAPIIYSNLTSVAGWLTSSPALSYLDAYKFFSQTGYSVGGKNQVGTTSPLSVNAEINTNIQNSANLVGISLYARVLNMDGIQSGVVSTNSQIPCPSCGTPPPASSFTIQTSSTNPTCNNAANGSITTNFNTAGLTSPYIYTYVNGSTTYQVTTNTVPYTFSGLGTGTWTVTVSDSAGTPNVSNTSSINLTATFLPTWSAGANNITFNLVGGYNNYYIGQTDSSFTTYTPGGFFQSNLTSASYTYSFVNGTYYFVIGDTDGCVLTGITITVTSSGGPGLTLASTQQPTCASSANGVITVNATGTGPFTYTFSATTGGGGSFTSPPTNSTTYTYSNAIAGNWSVTVTTSAGVSAPVLTTLSYNFSSSITSTIGNNVCFSIVGGNAPFTITSNSVTPAINNTSSATTPCLNNLLPGSYTFFVNDVSGCTVGPLTTTISAQTLSLNVLSTVNPNCDVTNNGQINVAAAGGFAPFTYSAYNSTTNVYAPTNTNGQFTNLSPGVWLITVRDSVNTTTTLSVTLTNLFYADITTSGTSICVIASGGSLGSYYVNVNGTLFPYTANTLVCYSANCGSNTVTVLDTNNVITACSITENVTVTCPLGYTYSATPISCVGLFDGSIQVSATGGTPPYQYSLYSLTYPPVINNSNGIFNNLGGNNWTLVVNDSLGNTASTVINLSQTFFVIKTPTTTGYCFTISGGSEPYVIEIKDLSSIGPSNFYTANTAGTYCFQLPCDKFYYTKITDNNGCEFNPKTGKLPCPTPLNLSIFNINQPSCTNANDGSFTVSATGGSLIYTYSAFSSNNFYSTNTNGIFTGLSGGTWTILAEDSFGATASTNVTLGSVFEPVVFINSSGNTLVNMCVTIPPNNTNFPYIVDANNQTFLIINNNLNCFTLTGFTGCVKTIQYTICDVFGTCCFNGSQTLFEEFSATTLVTYQGNDSGQICVQVITTGDSLYQLSILNQEFLIQDTSIQNCFTFTGITSCDQQINYTICSFDDPMYPLYSFNDVQESLPLGNLILGNNNMLYGLSNGDSGGKGALYEYDLLSNIYSPIIYFNTQPVTNPIGPLVEASSGILFGVATNDGIYGNGGIFSYNINTATFSVLYDFNLTDGIPQALIQTNDGLLYGLTSNGGTGVGTIFSYNISSSTYSIRYSGFGVSFGDGLNPNGMLFEASDGYLYGRTKFGGLNLQGTIFKFDPNTNTVTYPHSFSTGVDGSNTNTLYGGFIEINKNLYGLNPNGGTYNGGTLFKFNITANTFTTLHHFTTTEGTNPAGSLLLSNDGLLYGLLPNNGANNLGALFSYDINNSLLTIRRSFLPKFGSVPYGSLIEVNNNLYGTNSQGGFGNFGAIFSYSNQYIITCCLTDTTTIGETFLFSLSGTWVNSPTVCVSTNSVLPTPFYIVINNQLFTYASTPNVECYQISGCGETTVEIYNNLPINFRFNTLKYFNDTDPFTPDYGAPTNVMCLFSGKIYIIVNNQYSGYDILEYNPSTNIVFTFSNFISVNNINIPSFTSGINTPTFLGPANGGAYGFGDIKLQSFGFGPLTTIYDFSGTTDGGFPIQPTCRYDDGFTQYLYGSTSTGGLNALGTIYRLNVNTSTIEIIYDIDIFAYGFTVPFVVIGNKIYGVTENDVSGFGAFIEVDTITNTQTVHYNFTNTDYPSSLVLGSDGNLYGTCLFGGAGGTGYIFKFNTTTNVFSVVYEFNSTYGNEPSSANSLMNASNDKLYGVSSNGGQYNFGTVFEYNIYTNDLNVIKSFNNNPPTLTYSGSSSPNCRLLEYNGKLYGVTLPAIGSPTGGQIFSIDLVNNIECVFTGTTNVPCASPLVVTTISANTTCVNSGQIIFNVSGGSPNYLIEYSNGITSNNFISGGGNINLNNLTASTWTVTVTDGGGIGTSITNTYNLSEIYNTTLITTTGICVTYSGFNSPYQFFIDGVLRQTVTSTGTTVCLSASCGVNHILRILDGKLCNYYESFLVPCQPLELGLLYDPASSCLNTQGGVALSATGGSPTYNYTLVDLTNAVVYTGSSNGNISITVPAPTFGNTYYAYVVDSFGTSADTTVFNFLYTTYGNISFAGGYVYATYSADSTNFLLGGYNIKLFINNVLVYQQNGAPYSGGTIQYPIPCGINVDVRLTETFAIQDIVGTTTCTYTASTYYPCDLGCLPLTFERPCCDQANNGSISVTVTGGTAPFTYILTGPTGTFSATTNQSSTYFLTCQNPVVMGMCGSNIDAIISAGTYAVTVIDANNDTCSQTVSGIPYLNASFTANTNQICVYIDDGPCSLGTYSISVDGVIVYDYVNNTNLSIPANTVVCFTATCGTHDIQILAPFSPNGSSIIDPCQLNYTVTVPCLTLGCNVIYVNPTCDQNLNGSIGVLVTGGTGQYNYTLSSATGTVYVWPSVGTFSPFSHSFSNLGIGTYILTVTDQNGNQCVNTIILDGTFNVTAPLTSTTFNTICLNISGGFPPYDIYLNNNLIINNTSSAGTYCLSASCGTNIWSVTDSVLPNCLISGTTFVPCAPDLILTLISFTDPGCEGSPGEIIVSATSGTPPYSYTATNGTDIFINNTGIFTNLNSGTWYLSVSDINFIDSIPPITLTNTFFINVQTNSNSLCVTITGGTDPYTVTIDGTSYVYNTSITPNCYSVSGCGTSTITIIDSGSGN